MSKRTFGFNTSTLATAKPLLEEGYYTGTMVGASVVGKENKQHINIVKETEWNKNSKEFVETGEWIIEGNIYFGVALDDAKAIEQLQQEEPRVYGGRIRLNFHKEEFKLLNNYVLGAWLEALGLHEINFEESVDFDYNYDIEVPEELAQVPNILDMLNSLEYQRNMFGIICESANNTPVRVSVLKQPNYKTKEPENVINTGNYGSFCGILAAE